MTGLEELRKRHSVRDYLSDPINSALREKLKAEITMINTHEAGLNFQLCFDDIDPFKGFARSYGAFKNPRNYMAAVIDPTFPNAEERAGYFAEQFVMAVVKMGLGTCFVGGTYSSKHVNARMEVYEKLPFIVIFGHEAEKPRKLSVMMRNFMKRKELQPRDFFRGTEQEYKEARRICPGLDDGLAGIACMPSAYNTKGVRIVLDKSGEEACLKAIFAKGHNLVDLGIAKYNFELAAGYMMEFGL